MRSMSDLHRDIVAAFPGTIHGVCDSNNPRVNHWVDGVTEEQKAAVNQFIANYDWHRDSTVEARAKHDAEWETHKATLLEMAKEMKRK